MALKKYVIVTGAAGFIGSHLCDRLLADGHKVVGVDCFTDYYDRRIKEANLAPAIANHRFQFVEADLLAANLAPLLDGAGLIYHIAGQPGVRGSWGHQFDLYTRNNILATQRVLEAALACGRLPVVYAASSSAYGNLSTMPLHEDMAPAPVSPYGVTKLAAEHLCRLYAEVHDLPTIALRLFTVYGPRQRPDMAFQRFLTAQRRDQEITIYGDGTQTRDFTYVGDVVRAFLLAGAASQVRSSAGMVFNVAGGSRVTVNDVLAQIGHITGHRPHVRYLPAQPGDVRDTWADTVRAEAVLGFSASMPLADGLAEQWRHIVGNEV
ncbi:MAG: NAD-dependent epimerase/dehydratase family protein [Caldilineales bacterium]